MSTNMKDSTGTVILELDGASILDTNEIADMKEDITTNRDDIAQLKAYIGLPPSTPLEEIMYTKDGKCYPPHMAVSDGVTTIAPSAYSEYTGIKSIKFPETLSVISDYSFQNCTGINKLELSQSLTLIGTSAFQGCTGLAHVDFPPNVVLWNAAFKNCTGLTGELHLPASIQSVKSEVFYGCQNITKVEFPDSLTVLEPSCFMGSGLESIRFPARITSLKSSVVANMPKLKEVFIEHGIDSIWTNCFSNCPLLTDIYIPNTVSFIGPYVFKDTPLLQNITLEPGFDCEDAFRYANLKLCSVETLVAMLEALADRSETTSRIFQLGTVALSKLTDEQKAIATNKNWTLL